MSLCQALPPPPPPQVPTVGRKGSSHGGRVVIGDSELPLPSTSHIPFTSVTSIGEVMPRWGHYGLGPLNTQCTMGTVILIPAGWQ